MAHPRRPKVLFVTPGGRTDPNSRVRVLQLLPHLRPSVAAVRVVSVGATRPWAVRLRQLRAVLLARWADVVVLQNVGSARFARGLLRANPRVLYDIDDQFYPGIIPALPEFERVLVGNPFLGERVAVHNSAVTLVPTVVDESRFRRRSPPRPAADPVVIGWIGSTPNLRYVETIRPAFEALAASHPGRFVLKVVSGEPLQWDGLPVVNKPWAVDDEPADVESFDIGIMPLIDDEYSRQKCGYKALLSMAMSEPVVVSPVGVNADLVGDGIEGFHATTPDEWHDRLARLIDSPALRLKQGAAGERRAMRDFSIRSTLPTWAAVLAAPPAADAPGATYEIVTIFNDPAQYAAMRATFAAAGFDDHRARFTPLDNSGGNRFDPYAVLATIVGGGREPYVILCHQDVRLDLGDGVAELDAVLARVERGDPRLGRLRQCRSDVPPPAAVVAGRARRPVPLGAAAGGVPVAR